MKASVLVSLLVSASLLTIAPWTGHPFDLAVWFKTGTLLLQGENIYKGLDHFGYAPIWAYWAAISQYIYRFFDSLSIWRLLIKLPQLIGWLLLACLVGRMLNGYSAGQKLGAWIQLPTWLYVGYVTLVWGQLNALSAFFVVLALHFLRAERRHASAISLGCGVALKLYPLIAIPFFLALTHRKGSWFGAPRYLGLALLPIASTTAATFLLFRWEWLPFLKTLFYQPFSILCERCVGPRPLMNVWSLIWLVDPSLVSAWASQLLWLPVWLFIGLLTRRNPSAIMLLSLYLAFIAFFPRVSEQSVVDLLPFLLITAVMTPGARLVRPSLVVLPLIAIVFSLLNFGLTLFSPLLEVFNQGAPLQIDSFYATHQATLSVLMGAMGALTTIVAVVTLVEVVQRSSRSALSIGTWLTAEKPSARVGHRYSMHHMPD